MRKLIFLFITLGIGANVWADVFKATVLDHDDTPLVGASCVMFALPDSTFCDYTFSDDMGRFQLQLPSSDWYVEVSYVGYKSSRLSKESYLRMRRTISGIDINPDLPINIKLEPSTTQLQEVVVKASKGNMTMKDGIISFSNLDQIRQERVVTSAHDLLTALPLISSIDGNSLSLAGAPLGSVVYINDRKSQMGATELMEYLKALPPEQVKSVEIIYTPTPKWKTRSSIINVKLKKQQAYTFNGSANASGSLKHTPSGRIGASIFAGLPKLNLNLGYYFKSGESSNKQAYLGHHTVQDKMTEITDTTESRSFFNAHNIYASLEYDINKSNTITLNYNGKFAPKNDASETSLNSIYELYGSDTKSDYDFNAISLSYTNIKGVDVGVDYSHYSARQDRTIIDNNVTDHIAMTNNSRQSVDRVKGYVDVTTRLPRQWSIFYGASYEFNRNSNKLLNISDDPNMTGDEAQSRTDEHITTAYLGTQSNFFGGKLSFSASLKGEIYKIGDYHKNQLLPTAIVTYMPTFNHIFQASYQSFKNYPSLWQRQDYRSYSSPYMLDEGNPELRPSTYHVASLVYLFKQKYSLSLSYYRTSDFFLSQSYQSPDELVLISKPYNIDYCSLWNLTLNIPIQVRKILYSNLTIDAAWERYKSSDWHQLSFDNSKFSVGVMLDNSIVITQKPKISLNLTAMYKMPCNVGLWEREDAWLLNAGISGSFLKDRLTVAVKAFDLLQTSIPMERMRLGTQYMDVNNNYYSRSFSLEIAYKFRGYKDQQIKEADTSRYGFE